MIDRYFDLFLSAGGRHLPLIFNANQYDRGERWIFTLKNDNGVAQPVSSGAIIGLKSDGNVIANAGTVDNAGRVVITETEQMTAAAGPALFEILIDNENHGSANFTVLIEKRPGDDADISDSDISLIQDAIDAAGQIGDAAELAQRLDEVEAQVEAIPEYTLEYTEGGGNRFIRLAAGDVNKGNVQVLTKAVKGSDRPVTGGAVFDAVNLPEHISADAQAVNLRLEAGIYYVYGTLSTLRLNVTDTTDSGNILRYFVMFTSGETPTSLTLPTGCNVDPNFAVEANHTYEIEIIQANGQLFAKISKW